MPKFNQAPELGDNSAKLWSRKQPEKAEIGEPEVVELPEATDEDTEGSNVVHVDFGDRKSASLETISGGTSVAQKPLEQPLEQGYEKIEPHKKDAAARMEQLSKERDESIKGRQLAAAKGKAEALTEIEQNADDEAGLTDYKESVMMGLATTEKELDTIQQRHEETDAATAIQDNLLKDLVENKAFLEAALKTVLDHEAAQILEKKTGTQG